MSQSMSQSMGQRVAQSSERALEVAEDFVGEAEDFSRFLEPNRDPTPGGARRSPAESSVFCRRAMFVFSHTPWPCPNSSKH